MAPPRRGLSTKMLVVDEAPGTPAARSPVQPTDVTRTEPLLEGLEYEGMIADGAEGSEKRFEAMEARDNTPVIPPKPTRAEPRA